jgi:hypothetical protein
VETERTMQWVCVCLRYIHMQICRCSAYVCALGDTLRGDYAVGVDLRYIHCTDVQHMYVHWGDTERGLRSGLHVPYLCV